MPHALPADDGLILCLRRLGKAVHALRVDQCIRLSIQRDERNAHLERVLRNRRVHIQEAAPHARADLPVVGQFICVEGVRDVRVGVGLQRQGLEVGRGCGDHRREKRHDATTGPKHVCGCINRRREQHGAGEHRRVAGLGEHRDAAAHGLARDENLRARRAIRRITGLQNAVDVREGVVDHGLEAAERAADPGTGIVLGAAVGDVVVGKDGDAEVVEVLDEGVFVVAAVAGFGDGVVPREPRELGAGVEAVEEEDDGLGGSRGDPGEGGQGLAVGVGEGAGFVGVGGGHGFRRLGMARVEGSGVNKRRGAA
mmetsp:Transcript_622/g.1592  ORF Transcript_622/g.1592 Transcript_622/m.1592 type:complete len:311 (+) Transcript_622:516-1448(+)